MLGYCYSQGFGVKKDNTEAFKWFLKAAELGNAVGAYNVGDSYYSGSGVEEDGKLAYEWFQKAHDMGSKRGYMGIGQCYLNGIGVEQDVGRGMLILQETMADGYGDAGFELAKYFQKKKEFKEALYWIFRAMQADTEREYINKLAMDIIAKLSPTEVAEIREKVDSEGKEI
jgi:TPR repeat protein